MDGVMDGGRERGDSGERDYGWRDGWMEDEGRLGRGEGGVIRWMEGWR